MLIFSYNGFCDSATGLSTEWQKRCFYWDDNFSSKINFPRSFKRIGTKEILKIRPSSILSFCTKLQNPLIQLLLLGSIDLKKNATRICLLKRLEKQNVSGSRNWTRDEFIRELIDEVGSWYQHPCLWWGNRWWNKLYSFSDSVILHEGHPGPGVASSLLHVNNFCGFQ